MPDTINISDATRGGTAVAEPAVPTPTSTTPLNDAFASLQAMADVPEGTARSGSAVPPVKGAPAAKSAPTSAPPSKATAPQKDATPADAKSASSGKPASADVKSSATPVEPTNEPLKPAEPEIAPEKMAPKQLREIYSKTKARVKELEAKIAEGNGKPADDPEKKALQERLAAKEQELASISESLKLSDYEKSPDYKQKYWDPFVEKFNEGREIVASLMVKDAEGNDRQGTAADFDALMRIQDPNALAETVEAMFGAVKGAEVMAARREVINRNRARSKALEDYKAIASKTAEQTENQVKQHRETWSKLNSEAAEKFPQWFKATDGESKDEKANQLLEKGMALADYAFSGQVKPEEMVPVHSAIRNKAGAFDRVVYELQKERKAREELQKRLDEIESSAPGAGTNGRTEKPKKGRETMEGSLDHLSSLVG